MDLPLLANTVCSMVVADGFVGNIVLRQSGQSQDTITKHGRFQARKVMG
jgi:fatty acid/phospholipid biosynthesis enzyme